MIVHLVDFIKFLIFDVKKWIRLKHDLFEVDAWLEMVAGVAIQNEHEFIRDSQ